MPWWPATKRNGASFDHLVGAAVSLIESSQKIGRSHHRHAEEIIGKIPILPRSDPGPPGNDKIDSSKAFHGVSFVEGKAAWIRIARIPIFSAAIEVEEVSPPHEPVPATTITFSIA